MYRLLHQSKLLPALTAFSVSSIVTLKSSISSSCNANTNTMEVKLNNNKSYARRREGTKDRVDIKNLLLISGSAHPRLTKEIADVLEIKIADATIKRYADGECSVAVNENVRGRDVFIVQTCAAPVNDNIIELLLTISAVRRSGAKRVTAVVPYFGYKHHRRGMPVSSYHNSRFLSSNAKDFAKMMTHLGVDRVISVDLQRAGQGGEACFFDNDVPLETFMASETMIDLVGAELEKKSIDNQGHKNRVIIVAPNSECVAKARKFQFAMENKGFKSELEAYFQAHSGSGSSDPTRLESRGGKKGVKGANVIIVDDMVDTAGTIAFLSNKFKSEGAENIYVCASHGVLSGESMQRIDSAPIQKMYITNSLPISSWVSPKVVTVNLAAPLANLILTEYHRSNHQFFKQDIEDDYLVENSED